MPRLVKPRVRLPRRALLLSLIASLAACGLLLDGTRAARARAAVQTPDDDRPAVPLKDARSRRAEDKARAARADAAKPGDAAAQTDGATKEGNKEGNGDAAAARDSLAARDAQQSLGLWQWGLPVATGVAAAGVTLVPVTSKDVVYNAAEQSLYASVPAGASANANSLVKINPATGQVVSTFAIGSDPDRLAISDDGRDIYVSLNATLTMRRFDTSAHTAGAEFPFSTGSPGPFNVAGDIAIMPGHPETVAVSRGNRDSTGTVTVYDNGVARPNRTNGTDSFNSIEFASPSVLYASDTAFSSFAFRKLSVDAQGLSVTSAIQSFGAGDFKLAGGLLYSDRGAVLNPETGARLGAFSVTGVTAVEPDLAHSRAFVATAVSAFPGFDVKLYVCDLASYQPLSSVSLSNLNGTPTHLVRVGADAVALTTSGGQLYVVQLSAFQPLPPTPLPTPTTRPDGVRVLPLPANDLVYEPTTQRLYASVPSTAGTYGNSLAPIDPATAQVETPVPVGSEPQKLARADDGRTLYAALDGAGAVRRFDAQTRTAGAQFNLGSGGFGQFYVKDMSVQPGNASVVAVSRRYKGTFPDFAGVAVYDNGAKRSNETATHTGSDSIEFSAAPSLLYGCCGDHNARLFVDASGVGNLTTDVIGGAGDFHFENGLLYFEDGEVVDPESRALLGAFPVGGLVVPDTARGRVYFLAGPEPAQTTLTLWAFDISTFRPVGFFNITGVQNRPASLVRWGADGLAFRADNKVFFLDASLLHPYTVPTPTPVVRADGITQLPLAANQLVYSAADGRIYASVSSPEGDLGNTITGVDPATGQVVSSVFVGSEPNELAVSSDGRVIYTSLQGSLNVRRYDVLARAPGVQFTVGRAAPGPGIGGFPFQPGDLAVPPGMPDTVAVVRYVGGLDTVGMAVYDNGVQRPRTGTAGNVIQFSDTSPTLYSYYNLTTGFYFDRMSLEPDGLVVRDSAARVINGFGTTFRYAAGRIFSTSAEVADAGTLTPQGRFRFPAEQGPTGAGGPVAPDPSGDVVYFVKRVNDARNLARVFAFNAHTFLLTGTADVPGVAGNVYGLIRFGADGLAFCSSDGNVYILRTSMVRPVAATPPPAFQQVAEGVRQAKLTANDLVYDPLTAKIYASVPSNEGSLGNSIVALDPLTGTFGPPVNVGSEPRKLARTDDSQFLYVSLAGSGTVRRFQLATQTPGPSFLLGPRGAALYAFDMEALPGSPFSVAVARQDPNALGVSDVTIFDDGVARPVSTQRGNFGIVDYIEFSASASTLYGIDSETSDFSFKKLALDATGVSIVARAPNLVPGFGTDIRFDNGFIYTTTGLVINPETRTVVGQFAGIPQGLNAALVAPDSRTGRVFFLTGSGSTTTLRAYDSHTLSLVGTLAIPGVTGQPSSLIRWGADGLAFRVTDSREVPTNQIYLIRTSLVPPPAGPPSLKLAAATFSGSESDARLNVTVAREGDASQPATVDFATVDDPAQVRCDDTVNNHGAAYARCDYATTVETLRFAAGETTKTVSVPLIDDAHVEGDESFQVRLSRPVGATLGAQTTATIVIHDNDAAGAANPIFGTDFFVRMQYLDFLSREPEAGQPWSNVLNNCAAGDTSCDRISVSANFFRSQEFQLKGLFVFRFYKVSFNRLPTYEEIVADMRAVTGTSTADLIAKKASFTDEWAQRAEFKTAYDATANPQFVAALMDRYSLQSITTPDPSNPDGTLKFVLTRNDLVNRLNAGTMTRGQVVRAVSDSDQVSAAEFNSAFVAMQYYGYLRRTPEAGGYADWLRTINANPSDTRAMINGFMNSQEYRLRFGQP